MQRYILMSFMQKYITPVSSVIKMIVLILGSTFISTQNQSTHFSPRNAEVNPFTDCPVVTT